MIKALQRRFVASAMLAFTLVLLIALGGSMGNAYLEIRNGSDRLLDLLILNDGNFPKEALKKGMSPKQMNNPQGHRFSRETPFETRYFRVETDLGGQVLSLDTSHVMAISSEDAVSMVQRLGNKTNQRGFIEQYRYAVTTSAGTRQYLFVDCQSQFHSFYSTLLKLPALAAVTLLVLFVISTLISRRAVQPFVENMEQQKRFIADAGHELRTPLGIISANVDVLEIESGESEWTVSIRNQLKRLGRLLEELILLSKMDEVKNAGLRQAIFKPLDFSALVAEKVKDFTLPAERQGLKLVSVLEPELEISADPSAIPHLLDVLLDNAIKYALPASEIRLSLRKDESNVVLDIDNAVTEVPDGDLSLLFQRFYRPDSARARANQGGYGLGLALAAGISDLHSATITAVARDQNNVDGEAVKHITFVVKFPLTQI